MNAFKSYFEWQLDDSLHKEIHALLALTFQGYPAGRTFFKQQPVWRILRWVGSDLVAHCAIESRCFSDNSDKMYKVFGVADLAIHPEHQQQGLGKSLIEYIKAELSGTSFDFIVSFSGDHAFYKSNGFLPSDNECRWLLISGAKSVGIVQRNLIDCIYYYPLKEDVAWPEGKIDLLGSVF